MTEPVSPVILRRVGGLAFIGILAGLISLSVAVYKGDFTDHATVLLYTDHTGNQLAPGADVKERGVIVGSVHAVRSDGMGAVVTLHLDPSRLVDIPANVSAQLLPKTLFGEDYVSLIRPDIPDSPIRSGAVIRQDHSAAALETERVLGDALPLLQAMHPAELNATLTALATALSGRGTQLGQAMTSLDTYLRAINPSVPAIVDDLARLGQVAAVYNDAAPDVLDTLRNLQTGARTLLSHQTALQALLDTATDSSDVFSGFLADNRSRMITIVDTSYAVYPLLAEYSPSFACTFQAMNVLVGRVSDIIQNHQIQLLSIFEPNEPGYTSATTTHILTRLGPDCMGLPNPAVPWQLPRRLACANDGVPFGACPTSATTVDQQQVGSAPESALVNTLIAPGLGTTPDHVPAIATVLAAPALRGTAVTIASP